MPDPFDDAPKWVTTLPAVNAGLNSIATLLLLAGYRLIKRRRVRAHRNAMLAAFSTSILFLICYVVYHVALDHYTGSSSRSFGHEGAIRATYLGILLSHVILAAAVPFLALITIYRAWRGQWAAHARIARITFPIWLYVSVTGVIIYVMLYHWPGAAA